MLQMNSQSFEVYQKAVQTLLCVKSVRRHFGKVIQGQLFGSLLCVHTGKIVKVTKFLQKAKKIDFFPKIISKGIAGVISTPKASFSAVSHIIRDIYVQCCFDKKQLK